MVTTVLAFIVILGVLVFVHELGHFAAAKRAGIRVEEFGMGFPPRVATLFERGGTKYTLNALPIGGFVRMLGEEDPSHPDSFAAQTPWERIQVLLAGPGMNVLLAVLLFAVIAMIGVPAGEPTGNVEVVGVAEGSPAAEAGIERGDVVKYIANQRVTGTQQLQGHIERYLGSSVTVTVVRDGQEIDLTLTPREDPPAGEGWVGIEIVDERRTVSYGPIEAMWLGIQRTVQAFGLIFVGVSEMIRGTTEADLAGPVGIAQVTGELAREGELVSLINFAAFLSINLAIINLLPFPALDGGRLIFIVLELLRGGKRIDPKKEGLVHLIGMVVLLSLMLFITYFDVLRIFSGESVLR